MKRTRTAVIGGGLTGLVAAWELAKRGHAVTLLEASDDIGGLAAGFPLNGTSLEQAYHHVFMTDTDIRSLADELGIGATLRWHPSSMASYVGGRLYPFGSASQLLRFSPLPFLSRVRLGAVLFYLQRTKRWERFVGVAAAGWLLRACGKAAFSVVWKPLLAGKFHDHSPRVSMAWLWARVHVRANSKPHPFAREKLGYFDGGFRTLIEALRAALVREGVEIRAGTKVSGIKHVGGALDVAIDHGTVLAVDRVVATVPSPLVASFIEGNPGVDGRFLAKLRSIDYLGAVCMVITTPQSLSPYYWINVSDAGAPFLVFVQHTNLVDKAAYGGEHVYYMGAYVPHDHPMFVGAESEVREKFLAYARRMFPSFDPSLVTQVRLFRLRNAQHVVDTEYPSRIPPCELPVPGVYLSNFSQIFPEDRGTNYAVREGRRVAALVSG